MQAVMIVMPAVDIRDGACVQLVGGSYENERVRIPDPVAAARHWAKLGFRQLHVVDLDAATGGGQGSNREVVRDLIQRSGMETQVGGGVSAADSIRSLLSDGAARVVIGSRAVEEQGWLREAARAFPRRIIVAADVHDRSVVTRGWRYDTCVDVAEYLTDIRGLPLAGVLVTAVHREGRMAGPDLELMREVVSSTSHPVYVAGGIASLEDLRALARLRGTAATCVHAAIVGMALYTGSLDARNTASAFGGGPVA